MLALFVGYYERSFTTRVGTLELKVPRTRDGHFSPTVFERYQRNEKALICDKSVSKSFVSSLTEQLEPMVNEWQNRLLSEKNYPYLMTDVQYVKIDSNFVCLDCYKNNFINI
ncbi:hypothetical protein B6178_03010 [Staphylococcus aureus]|nr:hypothetical protein B6178_03010 [Staphylococcus aureus]